MTERFDPVSRRMLLKGMGGLSLAASMPGLASRASAADAPLTVADPGGPYGPGLPQRLLRSVREGDRDQGRQRRARG